MKATAFCLVLMLVLTPATAAAASYDVELLGVPRFVNTNYIDIAKIHSLSKFRSSAGHDYSDGFETCRSMKHYFMYPDATTVIVAPVAGTVTDMFEEWAGTQVQITSALHPAFTFVIFHIKLQKPLAVGDYIQEGQVLGTHIGTQTYSDIAVRVDTPQGLRLVSYFDTLTEAGFAPFLARGITSREQLLFTRAERNAAPYQCAGERFSNLPTPPDSDYVSLTGGAPPSGVSLVTGPLEQQTISLRVTPPDTVLGQIGGLFIGAFFPLSRGGTIYLLSGSGGWIPFSGCATAPAYRLGQLYAGMDAMVIGTPTNLTAHKDVVLYAGYGIGTTWQSACANMVWTKSFAPAYTVQ